VYSNKITKLPDAIGKLANLTTLNLFFNPLKKLPEAVGQLSNLEELNVAQNKLMMLKDDHFTSLSKLKVLSLYDNNLVRMGSLAPCVSLEELRIYGNNLEEMPALPSSSKMNTLEIQKNRVKNIGDDYFKSTPDLARLQVWGNPLENLPSSLLNCSQLLGLQAQETQIPALPDGDWPKSLETLFVQGTKLTSLPPSLGKLTKIKRVNLTGLGLDGSKHVVEQMKKTVLVQKDGLFWDTDGKKQSASA